MRELSIIRILEYYDVPQLFVAEDVVGMRYLCQLYDILEDGELKVLGVAVSNNKLNDFIKGHIDLLSMFVDREIAGSIFDINMTSKGIYAKLFEGNIADSMLPDAGYFYDDSLGEDEEMVARAITTNKPIIRLAFETPNNGHDIDSRCLSAALIHFQSLVDNSYKKLFKREDAANSNLRVTTFMAASFDVEFIANEPLDMFGQSKIGSTFDVINKLFVSSPEDTIQTLRDLKGYAANSYKNFLEVLFNNDMSINLKWVFSTLDCEVHKGSVGKDKIKLLHEIVNNSCDLGVEEASFEGVFTAADTANGKWTFQPVVGKIVKGDSSDIGLLSGITLKDMHYIIRCEAQQSLNETTLKEKTRYTLLNVSKK